MDKQDLYRYTGIPDQLYGIRSMRLMEGAASGCRLIEAVTAGGLHADFLPDTGLDIGLVRYKGKNVSFLSKNGYDSPVNFSARDGEFKHTFSAGLLYTCGLRSAGPPSTDGQEYHPLHGRIHGKQATGVGAYTEDDNLVIVGTLRETSLFGHALELKRRITLPVWGSSIIVEDTIENLTPRPEEFMIMYHYNFGYPLLSEKARLVLPDDRATTPRTEHAKTGSGRECEFVCPIDGEDEMVYNHLLSDGYARLENQDAGIAVTMRWGLDSLPILIQWKSMASGDYVLGIEPSNSYIMGRAAERENGTLQTLDAFGKVSTRVELAFESF